MRWGKSLSYRKAAIQHNYKKLGLEDRNTKTNFQFGHLVKVGRKTTCKAVLRWEQEEYDRLDIRR